jgi:hypothetical protein
MTADRVDRAATEEIGGIAATDRIVAIVRRADRVKTRM